MTQEEKDRHEELVEKFGKDDVFNTKELQEKFSVKGFLAPFVVVNRKSDGVLGSLQFDHSPRFFFGFTAD